MGLENTRTAERVIAREMKLPGNTIVPDIAPLPQDIVLYKQKPSAFYATPLASYLVLLNADSIILTGVSTSGCVRATAVDAFSSNYRVAVVEEGCFDRSQASHAVNLCDMHAKYADVVKLDENGRFHRNPAKGRVRSAAAALAAARTAPGEAPLEGPGEELATVERRFPGDASRTCARDRP